MSDTDDINVAVSNLHITDSSGESTAESEDKHEDTEVVNETVDVEDESNIKEDDKDDDTNKTKDLTQIDGTAIDSIAKETEQTDEVLEEKEEKEEDPSPDVFLKFRGRSLGTQSPFAPQSLIDVPDYGYYSVDGGYQAGF